MNARYSKGRFAYILLQININRSGPSIYPSIMSLLNTFLPEVLNARVAVFNEPTTRTDAVPKAWTAGRKGQHFTRSRWIGMNQGQRDSQLHTRRMHPHVKLFLVRL